MLPVIAGCVRYELVILHHCLNLSHLYHFQDHTIYQDQLVSSLHHIFELDRLESLPKSHSDNKFVSLDQGRKSQVKYHKCAYFGFLRYITLDSRVWNSAMSPRYTRVLILVMNPRYTQNPLPFPYFQGHKCLNGFQHDFQLWSRQTMLLGYTSIEYLIYALGFDQFLP